MHKKIGTRIINVLLMVLMPLSGMTQEKLSEKEALQIGTEAYIYGYPLITMEMTRKVMTNVEKPEGTKAPMGMFMNAREYPNASFRDVTAPNADTLYSTAWLDLSKEPYVLNIPDEKDRYFLMPMLSGWTDVFVVPGKRTTGTNAQTYVIVGPDWKGKLPSELKEIKSPTNMVWILGRTYCTGTPEDYKAVHALQDQYKLTPLSHYGKEYVAPKGSVDPSVDMKTPVRDQVNKMDVITYFKKLAQLLKDNPPSDKDAPILAKMKKIGIIPGEDFQISKLGADAVKGLEQSVKVAQHKIMAYEKQAGTHKNGWTFSTKTGTYGTDYINRAFVTAIGLGANRPEDAIYPLTHVDSMGKVLNGKNQYVLHFDKEDLPPVKGFWSLTMYNDQYFFVDNPLNKYTVSPRNDLKFNEDGSLDIYVQNTSPGKEKEANWLPAPKEDFILMLRLYWPDQKVISGAWNPPPVKIAQAKA